MKRAVYVNNAGDPERLIAFAREVESSGEWDGFFVMDHLQISVEESMDLVDPWVLLGAIASQTSKLMLGAMVTPLSRRRPWQLAKEIVTLDHISHGRVIVGIGLGGFAAAEFRAFGDEASLRERAARTDEALLLLDRFLRGEKVVHEGATYSTVAHLRPGAYQRPRPRIWIAATPPYRKPLARAKRWDGVFCNLKLETNEAGESSYSGTPVPQSPEELTSYVGDLMDRPDFEVVAMRHPNHSPEAYRQAGVSWLIDLRKL